MKRWAWWATAPVAVGLMLAASSQPYFSLYKGWAWTEETVIPASGGHFDFSADRWEALPDAPEVTARHTADVSIIGFQEIEHNEDLGVEPPEGFKTWLIFMQWDAPTDAVLQRCRMWATGSDGIQYNRSSLVFTGGYDVHLDDAYSCTPPREAGPKLDPDAPDGITIEDPRPGTWKKAAIFALPEGVKPETFHIAWNKPHYVTIELPEPEVFFPPPEPPAPEPVGP